MNTHPDKLFLIVDLETLEEKPPAAVIEYGWTSLGLYHDDPPERNTAWGPLEGEELFGIPEGQTMCPKNQAVHHISPELIKDMPLFDAQEWVNGIALSDVDYMVAHNAAFEQQWLITDLPWICTYKCALRAWPDAPSHSNQALKYYLGHEDRPSYYPPHRALPDAKVTALHLRSLLKSYDVETLVQWSREPRLITKFTFGKHNGTALVDVPSDYLSWIVSPKFDSDDADLKFWCAAELDRRNGVN